MKLSHLVVAFGIALALIQNGYAGDRSPCPCPPKPCCPKPCFEQGYSTHSECIPASINQAATFILDPCAWDVYFDASFTYWIAEQNGMDLAISSEVGPTFFDPPEIIRQFLYQNSEFDPGFRIGMGIELNRDDWNLYARYTWVRNSSLTHQKPPASSFGSGFDAASGSLEPTPTWAFTHWFALQIDSQDAIAVSSKWRVHMDLLDVQVSRPYYQGTCLIVSPFGGIRAAWIRQRLNITAQFVTFTTLLEEDLRATCHNLSNSWGVGPRGGLDAKWHLGKGFRIEADVAGSILFTRYTKVEHREDPTTLTVLTPTYPRAVRGGSYHDYDCLRAMNELNLGLGWGSYFQCYKYHLDLVATYDLQIFWNQNMMRRLVDDLISHRGHSPSNLYLQGLTLQTRFDF